MDVTWVAVAGTVASGAIIALILSKAGVRRGPLELRRRDNPRAAANGGAGGREGNVA